MARQTAKGNAPTLGPQAQPQPGRGPRRRELLAGGLAAAAAFGAAGPAAARRLADAPARALPLGVQPNILFVLTDDGPRNSYGEMENAFPVVSKRYKGNWLSYPNASCNDPLCAPGRTSTLTGLVSQHHHVIDDHTGYKLRLHKTWLAALQSAGYVCGGYGKLMNGWGVDFGSPTEVPPGFDDFHMLVSNPAYFHYTLNDNGLLTKHAGWDTNDRDTDYLTDVSRFQILDFIRSNAKQRPRQPWAIYWAPNAPHRDFVGAAPRPPARYADADVRMTDAPNFNAGPQEQLPWLKVAQRHFPLDKKQVRHEHLQAMRTIMAIDEGLREIMDLIDDLGILERTVIIVATDNCHNYGAYGLQDKGTSFEDALNFLLRIRYPGAPDGEQRLQAVSNIDIAPFVCELCGALMPDKVDGVSFVGTLMDGSFAFREAAPICHAKDGLGTPSFDGLRFPDRKVIVGRPHGAADHQQWAHYLMPDPWELQGMPPTQSDLDKLQAMLDSF